MKTRLILFIFITIFTVLLTGCGGDSEEHIEQTQKKLKLISQAIKMFKSENYFGKPPKSLKDLYQYETTFYNVPQKNSIYSNETNNSGKKFAESTDKYSLIPNRRVFLKSGSEKEDEDERLTENNFITDFEFLPNYQLFQPQNTIIAWDKAGNFNTGGNILFEDGQVKFIKASSKDYERFTTGLKTQTDRDFIRDICIKNNTDCSLANIMKDPPK